MKKSQATTDQFPSALELKQILHDRLLSRSDELEALMDRIDRSTAQGNIDARSAFVC